MVVVGAEGRFVVGAGADGVGESEGVVGVGANGGVGVGTIGSGVGGSVGLVVGVFIDACLSRLRRSRRRLAGFTVADW